MDNAILQQLIERAAKAREKAYAPYSNYQVGAAVLTKQGEIFAGCNVENASYGLSICAERNAVFQAVANSNDEGELQLVAVAVVTRDIGSPCGACRQVLSEFSPSGEMQVLLCDIHGNRQEYRLSELLAHPFGAGGSLKQNRQ